MNLEDFCGHWKRCQDFGRRTDEKREQRISWSVNYHVLYCTSRCVSEFIQPNLPSTQPELIPTSAVDFGEDYGIKRGLPLSQVWWGMLVTQKRLWGTGDVGNAFTTSAQFGRKPKTSLKE